MVTTLNFCSKILTDYFPAFTDLFLPVAYCEFAKLKAAATFGEKNATWMSKLFGKDGRGTTSGRACSCW
jgi:hypothetical protein